MIVTLASHVFDRPPAVGREGRLSGRLIAPIPSARWRCENLGFRMDLTFRRLIAEKLTNGESLPRLIRQGATAAGFKAFEPVERFLNTLGDGAYRDRPAVREQEALELLGTFREVPSSRVLAKSDTVYWSPLLEELRVERERSQLKFRRLSVGEEQFNLIGPNGLNAAYAEGEAILTAEASEAHEASEEVSALAGIKRSLPSRRSILTRYLSNIGFSRERGLEKQAHAVYTSSVDSALVVFTVDLNRCMQGRLLIVPAGVSDINIFAYEDVIDVRFEATCLALMANGRPYMRQMGRAEIARSIAFVCLALEQVVAKLKL
jgi:hypothetical protein